MSLGNRDWELVINDERTGWTIKNKADAGLGLRAYEIQTTDVTNEFKRHSEPVNFSTPRQVDAGEAFELETFENNRESLRGSRVKVRYVKGSHDISEVFSVKLNSADEESVNMHDQMDWSDANDARHFGTAN